MKASDNWRLQLLKKDYDAAKLIRTCGMFPDSMSLPKQLKFLASGVACSLTLRPCSMEFLSAEENKHIRRYLINH